MTARTKRGPRRLETEREPPATDEAPTEPTPVEERDEGTTLDETGKTDSDETGEMERDEAERTRGKRDARRRRRERQKTDRERLEEVEEAWIAAHDY